MASDTDLSRRPLAVAATVIAFGMLALYVTLVQSEGDTALIDVLPWALLMAVGAVSAFVTTRIRDPRTARNLMLATATLFGAIGFISILSIGMGFVVVAVLLGMGASRLP